MSLLDTVLSDSDRREYALLKEFRANTVTDGPGTSPEIHEHVAQVERRIGTAFRAGVSEYVNADPNLSALADEIVREAVRNAKHP